MSIFSQAWVALTRGKQKSVTPEKSFRNPDIKVYAEPFEWTVQNWSPGLVADAVIQANEGRFELMSDIILGLLKEDDRVGGALQQRKQGLTGLPLTISQESKNKRRKKGVETDLEEDWYEILPEQELSRIIEWGIMAGFCPVEADWSTVSTGGRRIPRLKAWNPKWAEYRSFDDSWWIRTKEHGLVPMNLKDPNNSKWFLFCPFGNDKPWNEGLWRRLSYWVLAKRFVMRDWARYSEVCGFPTWVLEAPEGWNNVDRIKAAQEFVRLGRDKAVGLPKGVKASIVEVLSPAWQGFQQFIGEANLAIIIGIMGQNLTSEVTAGAKASTVVHAQIANDLLKSDANKVSTFLHFGPFKWWTWANKGSRIVVPWAEWDTTPPTDMKTRADTENKVMATAVGMKQAFPDFDEVTYCEERYNMPFLPPGTGVPLVPPPVVGGTSV